MAGMAAGARSRAMPELQGAATHVPLIERSTCMTAVVPGAAGAARMRASGRDARAPPFRELIGDVERPRDRRRLPALGRVAGGQAEVGDFDEAIPRPGSAGVSPAWPGIFGGSGIASSEPRAPASAGLRGAAAQAPARQRRRAQSDQSRDRQGAPVNRHGASAIRQERPDRRAARTLRSEPRASAGRCMRCLCGLCRGVAGG